jgi:hypothetical protein
MKYVTTFNDKLYQTSGKDLLTSLSVYTPPDNIVIYTENVSLPEYNTVDILKCGVIQTMLSKYPDKIPTYDGGVKKTVSGYERRWFQWFRKMVMWYDYTNTHQPDSHEFIFLDCDIRQVSHIHTTPELKGDINIMESTLIGAETGFIPCKCTTDTQYIFKTIIDRFLSGEMFHHPRLDDSYIMSQMKKEFPGTIHDMARNVSPRNFKNSNGHKTCEQLLPFIEWGNFFEHDKGSHWRKKIVPKIDQKNQ